LVSVHPGRCVEDVIENTGFAFDRPPLVPTTPAPNADTLRLMRTVVSPLLAEVYPEFARRVFGHVIPERSTADAAGPKSRLR
jgi:glutaconate CoA-transferase subunit B